MRKSKINKFIISIIISIIILFGVIGYVSADVGSFESYDSGSSSSSWDSSDSWGSSSSWDWDDDDYDYDYGDGLRFIIF